MCLRVAGRVWGCVCVRGEGDGVSVCLHCVCMAVSEGRDLGVDS